MLGNGDVKPLTILRSSEYYIPAYVYDLSGSVLRDTQVDWISTDNSRLTVDRRGVATVLAPGPVGVYATYGSIQSNTFWFNIVDGSVLTAFSVSGRVTSVSGTGVAGVTVYISGGDIKSFVEGKEMTVRSHIAITDIDGNYSLDGFGPGLYTVNLLSLGRTFSPPYSVVHMVDANQAASFTLAP
jgi:drug/metabolite transporter superfamily protein YnfA